MSDRSPYSSSYDLGLVPEKGADLTLKPSADERDKIAEWLGIESLEALQAQVKLTRSASGSYRYRGHFEADVVQTCVVTLEPLHARLSGDFEREFHLAPAVAPIKRRGKSEPPPVTAIADLADDGPETIDSPIVDVAAPVLEELSLALDPYPRKPGVAYVPPEEGDAAAVKESPFSVLKNLKQS
jgi:uncharacterized metal-binding protein YceD (DUF177 family)